MTAPTGENSISETQSHIAWQWYDFTCPFCYIGQSRNTMLEQNGFKLIALPFQAHPEVPPEGIYRGVRKGDMYTMLEAQAREANLPLHWPVRLPNSRYALAAAEQVRRHYPKQFAAVEQRLFAAHFQLREDIGSVEVVQQCLLEAGIADAANSNWLNIEEAYTAVDSSEKAAREVKLRGTPAWFINGALVSGLQPVPFFGKLLTNMY